MTYILLHGTGALHTRLSLKFNFFSEDRKEKMRQNHADKKRAPS